MLDFFRAMSIFAMIISCLLYLYWLYMLVEVIFFISKPVDNSTVLRLIILLGSYLFFTSLVFIPSFLVYRFTSKKLKEKEQY